MYVSMKGMLKRANEGNYAVMAINCFNIETTRAVIAAAQSMRAPVIINIVQEHMVNHCDSNLIAPVVKKLAERASVEVALNFDHGEETGLLKKALTDGYTSVMVDASRYDLEGNIKMTREIVKFAEAFDASVEGEIGCMGASEGDQYTDDDMKTDPEEALKFARETGVDALAISFGSSHGNYPEGYVPEFDFEILKKIKEKTKMPLVLHGGSGSGDENIKKCVKYGINKINVGCDFMNANTESIKRQLQENPDINYWVMMHQAEIDSQELVKKYIRLSGSEGKSL
ncbi:MULTISPECIES: class II fructose-bisphosphate aldolase [Anaerostipes]|uniref:Fructose-bisphosphate aldolase n=1 Tax=Anaerostipes butyraticus TaxID=645466 RepID=A0A916Q837_9FIRM|nr:MULTISPECIES: class II fructose-bisphosphate aldolase [Anaerostipes]GFO86173.1 fructose-bisphosphate aldolase [Anaerostipes butyraticus]